MDASSRGCYTTRDEANTGPVRHVSHLHKKLYKGRPNSAFDICSSFEDGKSDKEILDHLLRATRYDKRLLPPVQGKGRINHLHDFIAFFDSAFDACVIT